MLNKLAILPELTKLLTTQHKLVSRNCISCITTLQKTAASQRCTTETLQILTHWRTHPTTRTAGSTHTSLHRDTTQVLTLPTTPTTPFQQVQTVKSTTFSPPNRGMRRAVCMSLIRPMTLFVFWLTSTRSVARRARELSPRGRATPASTR